MELMFEEEKEPLKVQGGIEALNKLQTIGISQAHIIGVLRGRDEGLAYKDFIFELTNPLLDMYRELLDSIKSGGEK